MIISEFYSKRRDTSKENDKKNVIGLPPVLENTMKYVGTSHLSLFHFKHIFFGFRNGCTL